MWLTKRLGGMRAEMLKKQHLVIVPPDSEWGLGTVLLHSILTADGRRVADVSGNAESYRKVLKTAKRHPLWLLVRSNATLIDNIIAANIHPQIAAIGEAFTKDKAFLLIRTLKPQRVVLCADGDNFEPQARLIQKGTTMITVGQGRAKYQIKEIKKLDNQLSFTLISSLGRQEVVVPSTNIDVVCEIAMAIATANELGCTSQAVTNGIDYAWR